MTKSHDKPGNLLQAKALANDAREKMQYDESARWYDHSADICKDEREVAHLRALARRCRKVAQFKRDGIIPESRHTG